MKEFHKKNGPFLKSNNTSRKIMTNLLISLLPIILFAIYKNGIIPYINKEEDLFGLFYPLIFILIPVITTIIFELLYSVLILKKKDKNIIEYLKDSFCIIPGILLGLILPINTPIYIILIGTIFGSIISKILSKIFDNKILNPVLINRLIIVLIYIVIIGDNLDSVLIPTIEGIGSYETLVKPYGNLINFFVGTVPGMVGTTSVFISLIAFIYLIFTKSIKWKIPAVYVLSVFSISLMIGNINGLGIWYPLFQILSGSLIFGAVFLATDHFTTPVTPIGQVLYGLFLGILTVIFKHLIPYTDAVFISILIMNMFVIILDKIGSQSRFNFKKSLIPFILAWILILGSGFYIGNRYDKVIITDPDYIVNGIEEIDNKVIYNVSEKDINANITIIEGEIIEFEILDQNESFYSKIKENNYIIKILKKQHNLDNLANIDGENEISEKLKKIAYNTLIDYKKNGGVEYKGDLNFNIISSNKKDDMVIYEVTQKAAKDNIKLRITFKHDVIDSITVIEQRENDFDIIIEKNYITKLIENQQVLENLDTIDEVKEIATSLKQAVINTKKDYWRNYEE